jgi:hypothetical protein
MGRNLVFPSPLMPSFLEMLAETLLPLQSWRPTCKRIILKIQYPSEPLYQNIID